MRIYKFNDFSFQLPENYKLKGNHNNINFNCASTFLEATPNSISWLSESNKDYINLLNKSSGNLVICSINLDYNEVNNEKINLLLVSNPKLVYINILNTLFVSRIQYNIHPTAIIHPEAKIHNNVLIGPFVVIEKATISEGSEIESSCHIHCNTFIGKNVRIKSNSIIGGDGFGYVKNEDDNNIKFPHLGGVEIADFVEIGSNTCIDRGTLGNTIIGRHTKIDNLVHIAHNVKIGQNCLIIANSLIGGSTTLGDNVWIAPTVTIRDGLTIGSNVTVGMNSLVTKNIPDGETWLGNPATLMTHK